MKLIKKCYFGSTRYVAKFNFFSQFKIKAFFNMKPVTELIRWAGWSLNYVFGH